MPPLTYNRKTKFGIRKSNLNEYLYAEMAELAD